MASYYSEWEPTAAAWIRQLIEDKQIPYGHVDDRSITEVTSSDLRGYTQAHFFAGVAGWPLALKLAGWPEDRPVWTASLPCQPFSSAGKQAGTDDERHLWPVFQRLVRECRPPVILGEQVASKIAREKWLPGVCLDLQAMGYPVTALDLCAPCAGEEGEGRLVRGDQETWEPIVIGAPHIRQRLYWVAYRGVAESICTGQRGGDQQGSCESWKQVVEQQDRANASDKSGDGCPTTGGMADTRSTGCEGRVGSGETGDKRTPSGHVGERCGDHRMAQPCDDGAGSLGGQARHEGRGTVDTGTAGLRQDHGTACTGGSDPRGAGVDADSWMDDPHNHEHDSHGGRDGEAHRLPRFDRTAVCAGESRGAGIGGGGVGDTGSEGSQGHAGDVGDGGEPGRQHQEQARPARSAGWSDFDLIPCRDGKARRVESGSKPLVAGLPRGVVPSGDPGEPGYANETSEARVMRLKGYGNSIVAPLATMFIETCMEVIPHE